MPQCLQRWHESHDARIVTSVERTKQSKAKSTQTPIVASQLVRGLDYTADDGFSLLSGLLVPKYGLQPLPARFTFVFKIKILQLLLYRGLNEDNPVAGDRPVRWLGPS